MVESTVESLSKAVVDLTEKTVIHVLHVDDEAGFLKGAKQCLEMQGAFEVETASSVEEAMEMMKERTFDAIVSDYVMPGKNGLDFLKELRESGSNIPFIMFTGRGREDVAVEALNLGADHYINKIGKPETVYYELAHGIHQAVKRKKAEERIRESEQRLRVILASSPDIITVSDLEGKIVDCNEAAWQLMGFTLKEELLGKSSFEFIAEKDRERAMENLKKTFEHGAVTNVEYTLLKKDEEEYTGELSASILKDASGNPIGFVGVVRDITERKKMETKIREQNEFLNNTLESLTHPFYVIDAKDYTVKLANSATGLGSVSEKTTCYSLTHQREKPCGAEHPCPLETVKKNKKPVIVEHIHYDEEGNPRNMEVHGYPIFDNDGNVVQMIEYSLDITERKKAERIIRENQEKFERLFTGNPEASAYVDSAFHISDVNPRFEELFGYSLDEIRGRHIDSVIVSKDMMKEAERLNQKAKKGYVCRDTVRKRKDGSLVHVSISAAPVIVEGKRLEYVAVYKDISQLKNTAKALKESEEKYRNIFEVAPDGMITINLKGVVTSVNPTFSKLTGYSEKEIVGNHFTKLGSIRARDIPRYLKLMSSALRGKLPSKFEYSYVRKNGTIGWAEGHFGIIRKDGKITGFQGILREVTEHKRVQKALSESEKRYQTLMEETPVGILNLDIRGKITYINKKFEEITGYPREEIVGKNWLNMARKQSMMSDETLKPVAKRIKTRLMGIVAPPLRIHLTRKNGNKIWVEGESKVIKRFGVPTGLQASFRDITELVDADESLKRSLEKSETLNEKLNVVGKLTRHDVRNKLSAVANNVYLAKQRLSSDSEALKYLGDIESACEHMERIFDFARTYERLGMEKLAYMHVEKGFGEATTLLPDLHGVKVVNDCHGLTVLADSLLRQLFYNLVDNSLKHGEKVSQIRVYYEEAGKDKLKLVYEDDGIGIPKAEKEKIFREDYGKDSGYGLFLIRKICEVYDWNVQETGKYGKGAKFTITIPKMNESGKIAYKLH